MVHVLLKGYIYCIGVKLKATQNGRSPVFRLLKLKRSIEDFCQGCLYILPTSCDLEHAAYLS